MKRILLSVLITAGFAGIAAAQDTNVSQPAQATNTNTGIPEAGVAFKPFPLIFGDTDTGVGFGISVSLYGYNGKSKDYLWKIYSEFTYSTKGQMDPDIRFDIPALWIAGQPFRVQGMAEYIFALAESYYGYANSIVDPAMTLGYTNQTNYFYEQKHPYIYFTISTPLAWGKSLGFDKTFDFLLGSYLEGYSFSKSTVQSNKSSYLFDTMPNGIAGGTVWSMMVGFRFDNRDYEPNPHAGTYNEVMYEFALAGMYNYSRLTVKHSAYFDLFPSYKRLVIAERLMVDQLFGDVPFFKAQKFGGVQPYDGIGGNDTMRGIGKFRFLDNMKIVFTPEIRWRFLDFGPFLWDMWHLELVLFSDIGGSWHDFSSFSFSEIEVTWGAALRILWGEDFIIAADFGFWRDQMGVYIGLDHQF